jgi:hypothetical protein
MPYRKIAPAPPPLAIEPKSAPIVHVSPPRDLLEELEKVEIDPHVLEEARRSNRAWGGAMIALGVLLIGVGLAMDFTMMSNRTYSRSLMCLPSLGILILAYGIRRWQLRGIDY